ncbi:MAG: leucine-rich repeat domain-containing protein, partial [Clostridiales bacterium]|nr:leucine-rich repeat domain-containing protein [Clostridiales bacterium]
MFKRFMRNGFAMLLSAALLTTAVPVSAANQAFTPIVRNVAPMAAIEITFLEAFPDANFRAVVLDLLRDEVVLRVDSIIRGDSDLITVSDRDTLAGIDELDIAGREIADLTGIEYFTGLETLYCDDNQLTSLDLSGNPNLKTLTCENNALEELNVSACFYLEELRCAHNALRELNVSGNGHLITLDCQFNLLTSLEIYACENMQRLICNNNYMMSEDAVAGWEIFWDASVAQPEGSSFFVFAPQNLWDQIVTPIPVSTPTPTLRPTSTPTP